MDQPKYTTLSEALQSVPDPRHARGKRYPWLFLLTLIAAAMPLTTASPASATITTREGQVLQGQALDGKEVRGAQTHGQPLTLVSLVQQGTGITLAQVETDAKSNEIPAAAQLLAGRDLTNTVTTADALHTQRHLAQQILDQNGHYLMIVKENQPDLYHAIALLFEQPPWLKQEQFQGISSSSQCEQGGMGDGKNAV
jgi:predicted transposase YbfD/YdcC